MAIKPPSDIVLDVAQAADPVKLQAAAEKLARIAAGKGAPAGNFAAIMDAARVVNPAGAGTTDAAGTALGDLQGRSAAAARQIVDPNPLRSAQDKAYQGLEAVFLQTYVEAMLPRNEGFFGDAVAGDTDRFFLAQQLATQLARGGRVGIAKALFAAHPPASGQAAIHTAAASPIDLMGPRLATARKL